MDLFDHAAALAGCARRDPAALRRLYDREAAFLLAVALRIVRRREAAEDVLHDAFLDIWERAATFDTTRGAGRAWVVSVVRHRALKAVRRSGWEAPLDGHAHERLPDEAPDALVALAATQEGARLRRCLEELAPERREVVWLAYREGLSQTEIAARLGAPVGTVKAWTRRSLLALKGCLS